MLSLFKKKVPQFFTPEQRDKIVESIKQAESNTSGEVMLFVESRCSYVNALDRAIEIFSKLNMHKTAQRNGVLVYVAIKDRQLAIYADEGIYHKLGQNYWDLAIQNMLIHFNREDYAQGISQVILEIGKTLSIEFPFDKQTDINELPDDIIFGK